MEIAGRSKKQKNIVHKWGKSQSKEIDPEGADMVKSTDDKFKTPMKNTLKEYTFGIGLSNVLLDRSHWAAEAKAVKNKWDHVRLKSFCTAKKAINKTKR